METCFHFIKKKERKREKKPEIEYNQCAFIRKQEIKTTRK